MLFRDIVPPFGHYNLLFPQKPLVKHNIIFIRQQLITYSCLELSDQWKVLTNENVLALRRLKMRI